MIIMHSRLAAGLLALVLASQSCAARDLLVDPDHGTDQASGLAAQAAGEHGPVESIAKAIALATAGDTVHLAARAEPYRECILLTNKSGEPGKPITIDGHGATLYGAEPLDPSQWREMGNGLYRSDTLARDLKFNDAMVPRMFMLFDARMQRMNRTSKGKKEEFKSPEQLLPGEWTYQAADKAFFIRIAEGQSLKDAKIEIPWRANGVAVSGKRNTHLVVKNLIARHFWNDGYNIHEHSEDLTFENIKTFECGDDGISGHEKCEYRVNGFVAIGNSTGICNVQECIAEYSNIYLEGNHAYDFFGCDSTRYRIKNAVIVNRDGIPFVFAGRKRGQPASTVSLENAIIAYGGSDQRWVGVYPSGEFDVRHVTSIGISWTLQGQTRIRDTVIAGGPRTRLEWSAEAAVDLDQNLYDFSQLLAMGGPSYKIDQFAEYLKQTGRDGASRWQAMTSEERKALVTKQPRSVGQPGADLSAMKIDHPLDQLVAAVMAAPRP